MSCNAKSIAINWTKQKVFVLFWTRFLPLKFNLNLIIRGGVEDTRLEAKAKDTRLEAKDTKKPEAKSKDCPFEIRPLEAKDRNARGQGHGRRRKCSKKKIFFLSGNFRKKKDLQKHCSGNLQNFNNSKNSAVLKPRTGLLSRN